jgi:hypothetical protein
MRARPEPPAVKRGIGVQRECVAQVGAGVRGGKPDAVRGVGDVEVKGGPDEGEAAGFAGIRPITVVPAPDLAERSLEQVRAGQLQRCLVGQRRCTSASRVVGQASGGVRVVQIGPSGDGSTSRTHLGPGAYTCMIVVDP